MANVSFTSLIKEAFGCNERFLHKPYCLFSSVIKASLWEFKLKQQRNPSACKENSWGLNVCACSASTVLVYVCANPQGSPQRRRKNTLASIRGAVSQTQRRCLQGQWDAPRMGFMAESSWGRHSKLLKLLRTLRETSQGMSWTATNKGKIWQSCQQVERMKKTHSMLFIFSSSSYGKN